VSTAPDLAVVSVHGEPARALHQPGPGPRVVLVHGASGTAATWVPVLPSFVWADVWAVDLPGRIDGSTPRSNVGALAAWLADFLEVSGGPAYLVGHSLGGAIALHLAFHEPDRVTGLALVSTAARLRVSPAVLAAVAASSADAPLDLDPAFGPTTDPDIRSRYRTAQRGVPRLTAMADWAACDGFDIRAELRPLSVPTVVVYGSADWLTPPKFQPALAEAVGGTAVEVEGAGHMLPWEQPDRVATGVRGLGESAVGRSARGR
jgi:pimeloyl-ACP methyl ester carboxylesterase